MDGVTTMRDAAVGESEKLRNDTECGVPALTEGRRETIQGEPPEERRALEMEERRCGERGAGEPGWTAATHAATAEVVAERRRGYEGAQEGSLGTGGDGRGCVGRFFWGGGWARNE
ncbi:hypothetical protein TRAPUB_1451 [Trametes pubescens]|uniref:Uncharacterized protein n=1 Tax=Trametes pubescens TaxID=154538 RepID=A0A1M2VJE3_TRAPU|nr:hypothetical protein TRAPUB_1451 [Trametes pubescens]